MAINLNKTKLALSLGAALCTLYMPIVNGATFVMEKNDTGFSIDGSSGAKKGQQIYLWSSNTKNENQQWVQLSRGNGYYSYKKSGTDLCWDGGNGGANRQAVTLETCDSNNQNQHWKKIKAVSGSQIYRFEKRNKSLYSIDGGNDGAKGQKLYLYRSDNQNINQQWELTDVDSATTTPEISDTSPTDYGLNPSVAPSSNFDLEDWYLSIPVANGGKATSIKENTLASGYEDDYFFTGDDGGMVFIATIDGAKTSSSTKFTRTELREMLRRGNSSIDTESRENNWAFSSIPSKYEFDFGGIDGELKATLAVNRVTKTSKNNEQVGRIVVGQIHAKTNEPIRLYYHKLPNNKNGAIYFAHETSKANGGKETWYNLLGGMVKSTGELDKISNPSDGIALDEHFSYNITVKGNNMDVTISQNGKQLATKRVNMSGSGYNDENNYMFFKAGIYLQDCDDEEKTCDSDKDDYAKATFYELSNKHDNYDY
jgi:poly(beta-D-mannuronate) lyase